MMSVSSLIKRLFPEREAASLYLSLVNRLGTASISSHELDGALGSIASEMGASLDAVRCAIVLRHEDGVRSRAAFNSPSIDVEGRDRLALVDVKVTRSLGDRSSVTEIGDVAGDLKITDLLSRGLNGFARDLNLKSILIVPLDFGAEEKGAIVIYRNTKRRWTKREKEFVQAIASCSP